jgi:two-component system sensor histidine kinase/response regulator
MTVIANETKGNILIVDDEPENLKLLSLLLIENGYKVRAAKTGKEALSSIQFSLPDLALLDIKLPDLSGFDICKNIKSDVSTKELPVLFLSALKESNDIVYGFEVGAQDYITKPFNIKEVLARVNTHMQLYLLRKELEAKAIELKIANDKLEKEIAISQQVELMRQKNNEIAELNAAKDKFFSIIAHDLRGPFVGFLGLTSFFQNPEISFDEMKRYGELLNKSANNLFKLLENLLTWARMQRGAVEFNPNIYKLCDVVKQNEVFLNDYAAKKKIELTMQIPEPLEVYADIEMLNTILRNLISNGIKFTRIGGKVIVTAIEKDNEILISIQDFGIGMNGKILNGLFKIDQKTARPGTEKESSTGLGLLLCKEFVEKHGGKVWAESEEEKGSIFYFTLPNRSE